VPRDSAEGLIFVVHQHQATRLHYDLRLQLGDRLVCWALPKGPSMDPGQRRLAVHVDDHPLEVADFEGVIPAGEYGAGQIILWDRGTWRPLDDDPEAALQEGKLLFLLGGQKLKGRFVLVRTRYKGERENWLLIKLKDRYARAEDITQARPESVLTGRTLTDLALWAQALQEVRAEVPELPAARQAPMPMALPPMWPAGEREPFRAPDWLFEIERRGVRVLAFCDGSSVTLRDAHQQDISSRLPAIVFALATMRLPKVVLDGVVEGLGPEAEGPDEAGEAATAAKFGAHATYAAFDLLHFDAHSLLDVPLSERRRLLSKLLPDRGPVAFVDHLALDGEVAARQAAQAGARALAKRADSPYRPGEKSEDWLFLKPLPAPPAPPAASDAGASPSPEEAAELAEQIRTTRHRSLTLRVGEAGVKLTNLDKVFWPERQGRRALLKRDLIAYYAQVSPWLLGYLQDRPLTLKRYVDGIEGESFYQRDWHYKVPDFARVVPIYAPSAGRDFRAVVCDNLATLLWLANTADVEMHAWYARCSSDGHGWPEAFSGSEETVESSSLNYPDFLVFDLDPWIKARGPEVPDSDRLAALAACREVAGLVREALEGWGLTPYVKTSGKTGLHLWVPIERRYRFDRTRQVARAMAEHLAEAHPDLVTAEWRKAKRGDKVLIDHMQNVRAKTLPAPFSLRATPVASVSMPLAWNALAEADSYAFTLLSVPSLVLATGDPWEGMLGRRGALEEAERALGLA